jgi:response regulator RpfG family c-di-GMP phosphodiesterase
LLLVDLVIALTESGPMQATAVRSDDMIVVDAHLESYLSIVAELEARHARVALFDNGEEALRTPGAVPSTLWLVNMRLPDMSGIGLLTLIRRRVRRSNIFLVGDFYNPEDELAARSAGATAYLCKPATAAWLDSCWLRAIRPVAFPQAKPNSYVATTRPP